MTQKEVMGKLALAVNLAAETKKMLGVIRQELDNQGVTSFDALFDISDRIMSGELSDVDDIMEELEDSGALDDMEEGKEILVPTISVDANNLASVEISLPMDDGGRMTAYTSTSDDNTIQTGCIYYDADNFPMDLCMAEVKKGDLAEVKGLPRDNKDIDLYLWTNPYSEDYTEVRTVSYKDMVKALSED